MAKKGDKGGSPGRPTPGWDKDWPPKPKPKPKLAKKNKKKKAKEPDYETNDNLYGEIAKGKFKRDPTTGPNET